MRSKMRSNVLTKWGVLVMSLIVVVCVGSLAQAATPVSEDFDDQALETSLENPGGSFVYGNQRAEISYGSDLGFFEGIQTVDHDWNTTNFILEVSFDYDGVRNEVPYDYVFIGIGDGATAGNPLGDSLGYGIQLTRTEMYEYISAGSGATAYVGNGITSMTDISTGITRVRMTRTGESVLIEVDADYDGTFAADYTRSNTGFSGLLSNVDGTNSHIYFTTGHNLAGDSVISFDDVEIALLPAVSISEDFNDQAIDPNVMEDPADVYVYDANEARPIYGGFGYRAYLRTTSSLYSTVDFTYEVSYTMESGTGGDGGWEMPFIGIGEGLWDDNYFRMPTSAYFLQLYEGGFNLSINDGAIGNVTELLSGETLAGLTRDTEHRVRMSLDCDTVTWEIDAAYTGTFAADYSTTRFLSDDAPFLNNTNARLFFGAGANGYVTGGLTSFDDLDINVGSEHLELLSDFDGDCDVDLVDFSVFASEWLLGTD